jgi:hypothetical protein
MSDDLLEAELRDRLHRTLGPVPKADPDWADLAARLGPAHRRRRQRRAVVLVAALTLLAVSALVVVGGRNGSERVRTVPLGPSPSTVVTSPPNATSTTAGSAAGLPTLPVRVLAQATVPGGGVMVTGTDGSAWVAVVDAGQIVHVSPTGQILGRVTLPATPGTPGSGSAEDVVAHSPIWLASGEGSIWALSFGSGGLYRIDPATGRLTGTVAVMAYLDAGQALGRAEVERVTAGLGHVWVTVCCDHDAPNQRLVEVDPITLRIEATSAPLPGDGESETPTAGPPGLFVTGEGFDTVAQLDPTTMTVTRLISVPGGAGPVTLGTAAFVLGGWSTATSSGKSLYRLDPATHLAVPVTDLAVPVQELATTESSQFWGLATAEPVPAGDWVIRVSGSSASVVPNSGVATAIASAPDGSLWFTRGDHVVHVAPTSR